MQLASAIRFSARRIGMQAVFVLFLIGSALGQFTGSTSDSRRAKVLTEATVLDVAKAPPLRSGKRRLLVKFEYFSSNGTRYVRQRRVRTERIVSAGQRITVRYRKNRPKYGRVASLNPPRLKVKTQPRAPRTQSLTFASLQWLIVLIALPVIGFGIYLFLTGRDPTQRRREEEHRPQWPAKESNERSEVPRNMRPQKRASRIEFPPKHKSKVVQRAGWF